MGFMTRSSSSSTTPAAITSCSWSRQCRISRRGTWWRLFCPVGHRVNQKDFKFAATKLVELIYYQDLMISGT